MQFNFYLKMFRKNKRLFVYYIACFFLLFFILLKYVIQYNYDWIYFDYMVDYTYSEQKLDCSTNNVADYQYLNPADYNDIFDMQPDGINSYKALHQGIMRQTIPFKIVINRNNKDVGYANKLYSFLSSLLSAIITDSALVVIWPKINKFIQEPFESVFIENIQSFTRRSLHSDFIFEIKPTCYWNTMKNMIEISKTSLPNDHSVYLYQDIRAYFYELASNPIYYKKMYRYGLVSKETLNKSIQSFATRAMSQHEKNEAILNVGFEVSSNLLSLFWKPVDYIQKKIDDIVQKEFKNNFVIGIQLRYQFMTLDDTQKFIDCAIYLEKSIKLKKTKIKWFITSDLQEAFDKFRFIFGSKVFFLNSPLGHVISGQNFYERAIMDVELLSKCDQMIITGGSTFGFIAATKSKKMPFYVNGNSSMEQCEQMSLNRPSYRNKNLAVF